MKFKVSPGLNTAAGYGTWLSIAAIAITAFFSNADAATPFWVMGGFLIVLCACIAIRVAGEVA
jgi:hypothetical protein